MNEQKNNKQDSNNQAIEIADLEAPNAEEIKGGPIYMRIDGLDGDVAQTPPPSVAGNPAPQTREHILLARQVG